THESVTDQGRAATGVSPGEGGLYWTISQPPGDPGDLCGREDGFVRSYSFRNEIPGLTSSRTHLDTSTIARLLSLSPRGTNGERDVERGCNNRAIDHRISPPPRPLPTPFSGGEGNILRSLMVGRVGTGLGCIFASTKSR